MKKQFIVAIAIAAACVTSGCATTGTDGIVSIGPDLYMVGGLGKFTDFSGSAVKARLYQDASKYCADQGRVMAPVNSTSQDAVMSYPIGNYASAEIQFLCLLSTDPRTKQSQ